MPAFLTREILLRWLLALGCFALLLFFFCPPFAAFELWSRVPEMSGMLEVRRGAAVLQQLDRPGAVIADPLHRVIQWRVLFPFLGYCLHLPPYALFALAPLGCALLLFRIVSLLRAQAPAVSWSGSALVTIALGAASWFFTSTGWLGYFDSWLALALLLVAFGKSRWSIWTVCLLAPWVDERFILGLPLALYCRHLWLASSSPVTKPPPPWRDSAVPVALAAVFVFVRLGLLTNLSGEGATLGTYLARQNNQSVNVPRLMLGVWEGLRAGWCFVIAGVVLLARLSGLRSAIFLAAATVALAALGLATAQDYSRSMAVLFPVAVLGALLTLREISPATLVLPLRVSAAAALLLPAHHAMNDRANPIFYLYHELAALSHPPAAAMPELYELRAIHAMESGDNDRARADLTLAIKLSANPASPAKQRGILAAGQGRWADALADFSLMTDHAPANPEAWLMRAQASLALGHTTDAHADFEHALTVASPGWSQRPDVARFAAKLNRSK